MSFRKFSEPAHAFGTVAHVFLFLWWWCPISHSLVPYKLLLWRRASWFFFSFKSSTTMLVPQIHPSGNGSRLRTRCYVRFITDQASHTRQFSGRKFLLLPYQHLTFLLFLGLFLSFILSFITSVTLASAITFIFSSSELVVQIDIFPLDCQVFRI